MSHLILRLETAKEPIAIATVPNDPKHSRIISNFDIFHNERENLNAYWISQSEFETYQVLELFPEFGCCYRAEDGVCSIGVFDQTLYYIEDNFVKPKSKDVDPVPQPQYTGIMHPCDIS